MLAKAKFEISARDKTKAALGNVQARVDTVKRSVVGLGIGVGGMSLAAAAGLVTITKRSLSSADALAKTSDKLGIATEKLAGLRHAADITGVSQGVLDKGLQNMVRNIADFSQGTGEAKKELVALGFSQQQLMAMSPDQQFAAISDAMSGVKNSTDRVGIAYKIFGGRATALLNTLALGREGLAEMQQEADALGLSMSRVDAAKIENANDAMTRAAGLSTGLGNAIAVEVSPFIAAMADEFVGAANEAGGMSSFAANAMDRVIGAVGFAADMVRGFQVVWKGLQVIALGSISAILTGLDELSRGAAAALSWIPGIDVSPSPALSEWAEESRNALISAIAEMERIAGLEMPSENINRWSTDAQRSMQTTAEEIAKTKSEMTGGGGGDSQQADEAARQLALAAKSEAQRTAIAQQGEARRAGLLNQRVVAIREGLLTEDQQIALSYSNRAVDVAEWMQADASRTAEGNALLLAMDEDFERQKATIAKNGEDSRRAVMSAGLGAASNIFRSLGALMGREGKKQNATQKLLARAAIVTSTAQAVMNALAVPPYPLGVALAAGAALQGAQQLRTVGGGGGVSSPVASPAGQFGQSQPIPTQPFSDGGNQQQSPISVYVTITGSVLSDDLDTIIADSVRRGADAENLIIEVNGERAVVA